MLIPYRSKNPPESLPIATVALIVVNTAVYLATSDHGMTIRREIVEKYAVTAENLSFKTVLTSMFLHAEPLHLIGNMLFLYILGFAVEGRLRTLKFVALYLLAGTAGDLLHHVIIGINHPNQPSLGASGAIMGVMGAALWMFPYAKVCLAYAWGLMRAGITEWPMWGVCLFYLGFDILEAALFAGRDGVGHFAHIGGAAAGFLICMAFRPKRDNAEVAEAKASLAEMKDLSILSRRELEHLHNVNPTDDVILLNWMDRSIRDGRVEDPCLSTFKKAIPRLIREADTLSVASCIYTLSQTPGQVPAQSLVEIAGKTERAHANELALKLYEAAFAHPNASDAEHETSLFRVAMISESVYQNFGRATACYQQVVQRWPMSPLADQARARLKYTEPRSGAPV